MNITRTISEQVAEKMVAPIVAKIKSLSDERQIISEEAIQNSLPKDLKDCFKSTEVAFRNHPAQPSTPVNMKLGLRSYHIFLLHHLGIRISKLVVKSLNILINCG